VNLDRSAFVADPALIEGLEKRAAHLTCSEERILFRQGDDPVGLYILKSGGVTLTMSSPQGHELVSIEAAPDSLLGLPGLVGNQPYTLTALAHAGSKLSFLTGTALPTSCGLSLCWPSRFFRSWLPKYTPPVARFARSSMRRRVAAD
jgi:CRP-like cAMP-binding protein